MSRRREDGSQTSVASDGEGICAADIPTEPNTPTSEEEEAVRAILSSLANEAANATHPTRRTPEDWDHMIRHYLGKTLTLLSSRQAAEAEKDRALAYADETDAVLARTVAKLQAPVQMILFCPMCGAQHVDAPSPGWNNPPHRSHLCHACGCIWRPADVPTEGVSAIATCGPADVWLHVASEATANAARQAAEAQHLADKAEIERLNRQLRAREDLYVIHAEENRTFQREVPAQQAQLQALREALEDVRCAITNKNGLNGLAVVDTVWVNPLETAVDRIDAALHRQEQTGRGS